MKPIDLFNYKRINTLIIINTEIIKENTQMLNDYGDILTLDELCEVLKISENVAYRLIREHTIPAFRVGRIYKIPKEAVTNYILTAAQM